ncbi:MAG: hypothetical protein KC636_35020, partial [Myxococcales bacterium]|nr:hypothetical protein [Myxococcales bacterium]
MRKPVLLPLLACALAAAAPIEAHAYSTRVHIMIANEIREALIASGDGSIPLLHAPYAVQLSDEDFQAIRDHSLA